MMKRALGAREQAATATKAAGVDRRMRTTKE
jgi:hypothetical protein